MISSNIHFSLSEVNTGVIMTVLGNTGTLHYKTFEYPIGGPTLVSPVLTGVLETDFAFDSYGSVLDVSGNVGGLFVGYLDPQVGGDWIWNTGGNSVENGAWITVYFLRDLS